MTWQNESFNSKLAAQMRDGVEKLMRVIESGYEEDALYAVSELWMLVE
jgi:hypothetical protein